MCIRDSYPVEVGIWQTLGDAYMRANRLKEALEAYNKAEELSLIHISEPTRPY